MVRNQELLKNKVTASQHTQYKIWKQCVTECEKQGSVTELHRVRNYQILNNKVNASIHTIKIIETMCCYLKSGNCIVRNQEILKNKLNSLTARAENNNLPGTATAVSSLDLEALWIRLTLPLIASAQEQRVDFSRHGYEWLLAIFSRFEGITIN